MKHWNKSKANLDKENNNKKAIIKTLEKQLEKIEQAIIQTSNIKLREKLEMEWNKLDTEKENLLKDSKTQTDLKDEVIDLLGKTQLLFENPKKIRAS